MKEHIYKKRRHSHGRFFFTAKDMAEAKLNESIAFSVAKREGRKLSGVHQYHCSCGAEGCWLTSDKEESDAKIPKNPKGKNVKKKYGIHPHISGKVVL